MNNLYSTRAVVHWMLFSSGRRSKFSSGVWDAWERSKEAFQLLKHIDDHTSLSFGTNGLNTAIVRREKKREKSREEQRLSAAQSRISESTFCANSVVSAPTGVAAVFAVQTMRRPVFASLRSEVCGTVPRASLFP